jgi:hypothetical protein
MMRLMAALLLAQATLSMTTIARNAQSGVDQARQVVVKTGDDWRALWKEHAPMKPLPEVDFTQSLVLAVFMGSQPTGGYMVEIRRVRAEPSGLVVEYAETRPGPADVTAQVITSPCHIVTVPQHAGTITFERVDSGGPRVH